MKNSIANRTLMNFSRHCSGLNPVIPEAGPIAKSLLARFPFDARSAKGSSSGISPNVSFKFSAR